MEIDTSSEASVRKDSFFDEKDVRAIVGAVGELPRSPGSLLLMGAILFIFLGSGSGIIKDEYFYILSVVFKCLITYWFVVVVISKLLPRTNDYGYGADQFTAGSLAKSEEAPQGDIQQRAHHEAGHVIAIALFPQLPDIFDAWISTTNQQGTGGRVNYSYTRGIEVTTKYLEASRIFSITPLQVEEFMLGKARAGSDSDLQKWECTAKQQLNNFPHNEVWYRSPSSELEAAINGKTLKKLLDDDLCIALEVVKLNVELINDIAAELIANKRLSKEQIQEYIGQVKPLKD